MYNGHKNWTQWNVSLWVNNDEGLYELAKRCIRRTRDRDSAAQMMLDDLLAVTEGKTPDGATYSKTAIKAAMVEM